MSEERPARMGPPMSPDTARIESAIDAAVRRGDFDDLPGAGKPLKLPSRHDPDWWIKQRLAEDDVDRDALLPVVVLLRREHDQLDDTLAELRDERAVREYARDFTSRVRSDRVQNPLARMMAPELDEEDALARWRELRAAREAERAAERAEPDPPTRRRRWWWPFGPSDPRPRWEP